MEFLSDPCTLEHQIAINIVPLYRMSPEADLERL